MLRDNSAVARLVSHQGPGQTDAAIFADHLSHPAGATASAVRLHQWGLNLTLGGRCRYRCGDERFTLERGDIFLQRPQERAEWRVPQDSHWETVYAVFYPRPHWHAWLNAHPLTEGFWKGRIESRDKHALFRNSLMELTNIYKRLSPHRDEWALWALEKVLLTLHEITAAERSSLHPGVRAALDFIHNHFTEPLTIHDIAVAASLSVSHLSSLFSQQLNTAPVQHLERVRIERAGELLRFTPSSIRAVANFAGYKDPDYFGRRFALHTGFTPRAFRKMYGQA